MDVDLIYIFHDNAGDETLDIKGELYKYIIKVRRHCVGDIINFRNKVNISQLCTYEIISQEARIIKLRLKYKEEKILVAKQTLHIAWCVIDSKHIEKVLPSLSEIGVKKISFIYCDKSQKNFKVNLIRLNRILEASMQQSGSSSFIEFDTYKNIESFIDVYPETKVFDFCENTLKDSCDFKIVLIGCEGGFSQNERELLTKLDNFRLNTPMTLRSESAVLAVASKILI
jgi:16S rRNA (uracil1498-N3)-methyltransferase